MDLLVEKLDGSRYYLSQYMVLITDFEESAPSVTRNNMQLDQRNGNIDFGGWHTDKTINITGYYRADDIDEEETLREKLYALLSDPDGYYITQLKATPSVTMERPGETSGDYYDKLSNYPSHKRFLVYTEAPEMELVGNVNGTLLYKLTAEFKTMKLPYGESVPQDLDVKPNVPYYGRNYLLGTGTPNTITGTHKFGDRLGVYPLSPDFLKVPIGTPITITYGVDAVNADDGLSYVSFGGDLWSTFVIAKKSVEGKNHISQTFNLTQSLTSESDVYFTVDNSAATYTLSNVMFEIGATATPHSIAPEDPGYNEWYLDTYYNTDNLFIPYAGTVPCNQLEQGFAIEMTAKGASSSLSFKIDDTELTYSGAVASGDVFMFSGFSYTQNGLSIVSKTNKAYFVLQPDKPNQITCNVPGTVRILGFQNLYA